MDNPVPVLRREGLGESYRAQMTRLMSCIDNIHWSLSSAHGSEIADDSFLWRGKVEGDGVDMDTNTISLQGAGHVTLGRFDDSCPGNPSMCENGFTVSFWMKYGGKVTSKW